MVYKIKLIYYKKGTDGGKVLRFSCDYIIFSFAINVLNRLSIPITPIYYPIASRNDIEIYPEGIKGIKQEILRFQGENKI